ncbi:TonB family protein [Bordetella petrii]|nr:TonB family protein [Bordetella petrii]
MLPQYAVLSHLAVALIALCAFAAQPSWAQDADRTPPAGQRGVAARFDFDITAQPLAEALRRYASLTRLPTLFRSDLVKGRTSAPVRGRYSAEAALRELLDGTGLAAEKSNAGPRAGFVLTVAPSAVMPRTGLGDLAGYPSQIQGRVWDALCADARTAPGAYRSLLRFQVDATGRLQRPRLLSSTGDGRRDEALLAALRRVRLGGPPPPGLAQPVTMLIVPREDGGAQGPRCGEGAP